MALVVVVCLFVLAVVVVTFFAVHKIKPRLFKINATITRWVSFAIEIDRRGQSPDASAGHRDQHDPR
ncbi:MAG TPA: hypothetical protein VFU43_04970 [Streptosporangiaceae bacterium]|nr:hypothetical protein [Streptosporangiaceae bacterium]